MILGVSTIFSEIYNTMKSEKVKLHKKNKVSLVEGYSYTRTDASS